MSDCKHYKSLFPEALYGELNPADQSDFEHHLALCRLCKDEYTSFRETSEIMSRKKLQNPGEDFWDNYWQKLDKRLQDEEAPLKKQNPKNRFHLPGSYQKLTYRIIGAAAMLLVGIGIGYILFTQPSRPVAINMIDSSPVEKVSLNRETANYLESSKLLLLGFVNFDTDQVDPSTMDFSKQQELAGALIRKTADLKKDLKGKKNQRVLELIRELEIILLQISNYEKDFNIPAIELIKSGVDNSSILMKINIEELIRSASVEKKNPDHAKNRMNL